MPSTYSTDVLIGVVAGLLQPSNALLARYFQRVTQDESEEIHFDLIDDKRRIAPFVSPLVEGQIVEGLGFTTKSLRPAYIKDKRVFDPSKPLKRSAGEQIGGSLTPEQRRGAYVASEMQDQINMVGRRLELMAAQAIRLAAYTIKGEKYPAVNVDFQRDATLRPTALSGGSLWSATTSKPRKDIATLSKSVRQKSGANPTDVIMGDDAFEAYAEHATVKDVLDNRNINAGQLTPGTEVVEGLTFQGVVDRKNIFTYSGWYVDPDTGVETEMWPADEIAVVGPAIEGVRAFGAIRDGKAGYRALPYFPKMWEEEDPSVEYLLLQSAPLIVPTRPNASGSRKVL